MWKSLVRGWQGFRDPYSGFSLPQLPSKISDALYSHQKIGVAWLHHHRARVILADDMGLGKTLSSISYITTTAPKPASTLVICPPSLIAVWQKELFQWANLSSLVYQNDKVSFLGKEPIVLASYDALIKSKTLQKHKWQTVVFDEAQAVKNMLTSRWQAANSLQAHSKLALTGTPIENNLEELYAIMLLVRPETVKDLNPKEFAKLAQTHKRQWDRRVKPYLLVRRKEDLKAELGLRDKTIHHVVVPMTSNQRADYDEIAKRGISKNSWEKENVLTLLNKLRLAANGPAWMNKPGLSGKDIWLQNFLHEENTPKLLFTQYTRGMPHLKALAENLGWNVYTLSGQDTKAKRKRTIQAWQDDPNPRRIFIISLRAGGTGLTLIEADAVIHYDQWYNPAVEDQASDRSYRIGQTEDVDVYVLTSENSLESHFLQSSEGKRLLQKVLHAKDKKKLSRVCLGQAP